MCVNVSDNYTQLKEVILAEVASHPVSITDMEEKEYVRTMDDGEEEKGISYTVETGGGDAFTVRGPVACSEEQAEKTQKIVRAQLYVLTDTTPSSAETASSLRT